MEACRPTRRCATPWHISGPELAQPAGRGRAYARPVRLTGRGDLVNGNEKQAVPAATRRHRPDRRPRRAGRCPPASVASAVRPSGWGSTNAGCEVMHSAKENCEVVHAARAASSPLAAAGALMNEHEAALLVEELQRPHRSAAARRSVSGVHVDVTGPKAERAVVRVAIAFDVVAAIKAGEALASAREAPRQKDTSLRRTERGAPNGSRVGSPSRGARGISRRSAYLLGE